MEALKEFIETKCKGYAKNAGDSVFMGVRLSELSKDELLAIFWYQEQESKGRLERGRHDSFVLGGMAGINGKF